MEGSKSTSELDSLRFDNCFLEDVDGDSDATNTPRQVLGACYSRVAPLAVPSPRLIAVSPEAAGLIGLGPGAWSAQRFAEVFSGKRLLAGMQPFAMCYGGHQFGHWAGQLGDGRAINLGQVNYREASWTLQLKGAGPTPYSRTADGLAVLRSSVREFLCSEAMQHLGVPTTRALSLVLSGERVWRDMFYDGNARFEPGAIVCRMAPSFLRFGSFQIHAARRDEEQLKQLLDHSLRRDFAHLGEPGPRTYERWFEEVCQSTLRMVVDWMRVGFVHGVMNTDNMSILGLTIDYGPYGWLENYDPNWTPNTTDAQGKRYAFGNQPQVALWNLAQLANAIHLLIGEVEGLERALGEYSAGYGLQWHQMMCAKLGWTEFEAQGDPELIVELLAILELVETDMTIFFRQLADYDVHVDSGQEVPFVLREAYYDPEQWSPEYKARLARWLTSYRQRAQAQDASDSQRQALMQRTNPKYVLRNWLAQEAIDRAEQGDYAGIEELLEVLRHPYQEQPGREAFARRRPEWARSRAGCSMLSCSS